jgi:hypothetical protein
MLLKDGGFGCKTTIFDASKTIIFDAKTTIFDAKTTWFLMQNHHGASSSQCSS